MRAAFSLFFCLLAFEGQAKNNLRTCLFDGKTLQGWEGDKDFFRVEKQCIVAGSLDRAIPGNRFLASTLEFKNFELQFQAKLIGQGKNAGVQFWSQRLPNSHEMIGYQCDIGSFKKGKLWGWLYDESRRNKFLASTEQAQLEKWVFPKGEWNQMRVQAFDQSIRIWVNNQLTVDYVELQKNIASSGKFGLQVHGGPPLEAWYREIQLRSF